MSRFLGQHFLKNKTVIKKIIGALDLQRGDVVIEIGPGRGALTIPLVEQCHEVGCSLIAIEKDPELGASLGKIIGDRLKNIVKISTGDALKLLPSITHNLVPTAYKIVGNIPYYITGILLRVISELNPRPIKTVLMVQKEVAERVAAKPPTMNLLSAATQIWANASIIARLKPNDFDPPPKVSSAVIVLTTRPSSLTMHDMQNYYNFIHRAFKQPRKTLLNNLTNNKEDVLMRLKQLGYTEKTRAQELSIEQLLQLAQLSPFYS